MVTFMIMMVFLGMATFQIILIFNAMFIKLLFIFLQLYTQESYFYQGEKQALTDLQSHPVVAAQRRWFPCTSLYKFCLQKLTSCFWGEGGVECKGGTQMRGMI